LLVDYVLTPHYSFHTITELKTIKYSHPLTIINWQVSDVYEVWCGQNML